MNHLRGLTSLIVYAQVATNLGAGALRSDPEYRAGAGSSPSSEELVPGKVDFFTKNLFGMKSQTRYCLNQGTNKCVSSPSAA